MELEEKYMTTLFPSSNDLLKTRLKWIINIEENTDKNNLINTIMSDEDLNFFNLAYHNSFISESESESKSLSLIDLKSKIFSDITYNNIHFLLNHIIKQKEKDTINNDVVFLILVIGKKVDLKTKIYYVIYTLESINNKKYYDLIKNKDNQNIFDTTKYGGKSSKADYKSTGEKIKFVVDGKQVSRVVHVNKRGTKYVSYDKKWMRVSNLKK